MTDRELLELAAKEAGMEGWEWDEEMQCMGRWEQDEILGPVWQGWIPLDDDGDALRLAVTTSLEIYHADVDGEMQVHVGYATSETGRVRYAIEPHGDDAAATRRAIVRAAAELQRQKERK